LESGRNDLSSPPGLAPSDERKDVAVIASSNLNKKQVYCEASEMKEHMIKRHVQVQVNIQAKKEK
jgi:hypothetical protein